MKSRDEIESAIELSDVDAETGVAPETHPPLARSLAEIIGQGGLVRRLTGLVELARRRGETLGHILLLGPDGCGKRTAAHTIARELGVNLRAADASQIERAGDLASIINLLGKGDVLLLENVNRLHKHLVSVMLPALKDFELSIIVGKGSGARTMRLAVKPFTLIGTAEKQSDCSRDLLNAFHAVLSFQRYNETEIIELADRLAAQAGISLEPPTEALIGKLSDGNPARTEMMMRRLKLVEKQPVNEHDAKEMLSLFGFDSDSSAKVGGDSDRMGPTFRD